MNNVWIVTLCQDYESNKILGVYKNTDTAIHDSKIEIERVFSVDKGRSKYKGKSYKLELIKILDNDYKIEIIFENDVYLNYDKYIIISEYPLNKIL